MQIQIQIHLFKQKSGRTGPERHWRTANKKKQHNNETHRPKWTPPAQSR